MPDLPGCFGFRVGYKKGLRMVYAEASVLWGIFLTGYGFEVFFADLLSPHGVVEAFES